ncbi:MAG: phosphodiester glycosidase family protein [Clostridia bacterium]|nr:phosphodiester glycosidase family protein [Clostridia bacterium]
MKLAKRTLALLMCAIMLVTSCIIVSAGAEDKATISVTGTVDVNEAVSYEKLSITSGQNGNTLTAVGLEFDPDDGYIPMVFSGYSGNSAVLKTQYNIATQKYGYEVPAIINGAFFSMDSGTTTYGNYGTLVGIVISNGKIASAHAGYSDSVVAFGSDGSMNIVKSSLDYKLYINGEEIKNGLYYINKTSGSKVASNWSNNFYYYDTSCGRVCDTYAICPGYEVICEKVDNTDLTVGGTLKGKVLEVKENSYGAAIAEESMDLSNKFVLFVKSSSPNAKYVKDLAAGDSINIGVNETNIAAKEIMENANSVITNVGWLVKDGVDRTRIDAEIGTHKVTLQARWTAFGQKEDGSYVFFTSEGGSTGAGGSLTLRDVADYMISKGCVNVIRMDGGGSSAMYVSNTGNGQPDYAQSSTRSVGDCILVVKKSSVKDEALEAALQAKIDEAKAALAEAPNESISALVSAAEALLASEAPVSGDVRKMLSDLSGALSGKDELTDLVAQATGISYKDYSEAVLGEIRAAYDNAVAILGSEEATFEDVENAAEKLETLLALTGESTLVVSTGASYTTTEPNRGAGNAHNDDGIRLSDGSKGNADAGLATYAGWNSPDKSKPNVVEVTFDLGEAKATNSYTVYMAGGNWGINLPKGCISIEVFASDDNETFKSVAKAVEEDIVHTGGTEATDSWSTYTITATGKKAVAAKYIKVVITHKAQGNGFIWIDEVEAGLSGTPVTDAIYVTNFNQSIQSGNCNIFTPAIGTITGTNANHKWTTNVILEATENAGEYVVVRKFKGNGTAVDITLEANQIMIAAHTWDETVPGSGANEKLLGTAEVGQKVMLYGIDVENCVAGVAAYIKLLEEEPVGILGDVNNDGKIDQYDYVLVKRHHFDTRTLTDDEATRADANKDGKVDTYDYLLIARHYFGTYVIK